MKVLLDLFPIILFFAAYYLPGDRSLGIYYATAAAMIGSLLQVSISWLLHRRVERLYLITFGLLLVLGTATLALRDNRFIMWKPTAVNWVFAVVFFVSQYVGKRNIVARMMGASVALPDIVWTRLNLSWVGFFIAIGIINLYVAFNFAEETWVQFKLFGILALTLLFTLGTGVYIACHMKDPEGNPD